MQTVYLNGEIAKFGEKWQTSCNTVAEILRLIECQTPGFRKHLIDSAEAGIDYQIMRGKEFIDADDLFLSIGEEDIIITELPAGAGKAGKVIVGAILVITAVILALPTGGASFSWAAVGANIAGSFGLQAMALVGVSLITAGISEMMMPGPEVDGTEQNRNYLFQGPVNTMSQGMPVPLAYGELIVGGAPIGVSFSSTPIHLSDPSYSRNTSNSTPTVDYTAGDTQNSTDDQNENDNDNTYDQDWIEKEVS